jgi:hypothetical protein
MIKGDFESKLHPDKIRNSYEVRGVITDVDMIVYYVVLAQAKPPSEIWNLVPENLKKELISLIDEALRLGVNRKPIVGGPFEAYWDHSLVLQWKEFLDIHEQT